MIKATVKVQDVNIQKLPVFTKEVGTTWNNLTRKHYCLILDLEFEDKAMLDKYILELDKHNMKISHAVFDNNRAEIVI